jgi:hypothetical protein
VDDVVKLTEAEVREVMPNRVTNADLAKALEALDMGENEADNLGDLPDIEHLAPWLAVAELAQMWEDWDGDEEEIANDVDGNGI